MAAKHQMQPPAQTARIRTFQLFVGRRHMRQRNINVLVGHLCARVAGFGQPLQVVGGQLDGIFVAAGQRVEVLPLKLLLHRIHVQTQKRAGCQPQRVPVALNPHGRAEQLRAAPPCAEHPGGERTAACRIAHRRGKRVFVARNHVNRYAGLEFVQHLDERVERLRVPAGRNHVSGEHHRVKIFLLQRKTYARLIRAIGRALEIGNVQQRISFQRRIHFPNRHGDARNLYKLIDRQIGGQRRKQQKQQKNQNTPAQRRAWPGLKKFVAGLRGFEMRGMLRGKGIKAASALRGASVHG